HVSDTALWVATYRAMESERPDALFHDPYARKLAGARGEHIMRSVRFGVAAASAMIIRTKVFDEIIMRLIAERGVDEVLNLACGLDARAYRLSLPGSLRWTDVDFPDMIAYRSGVLAGETPACVYEAAGVDLSDPHTRDALFDRIAARSKRVAVLSEGLLLYLTPDDVGSLATALTARPTFAYWLTDLNGAMAMKMMTRMWGKSIKAGTARFQFAPVEGTKFFERFGWRETEYHSNWDDSARLKRGIWMYRIFSPFMALLPPKRREVFRRGAGAVLLERT
ncbi:MAG TPA: SAM-dependent methyltransferase, partial [Candidatus Eremiobacteraceae bacterium]